MTFIMYGYGTMTNSNTRVIHVFGTMLRGGSDTTKKKERRKTFAIGTIGHFSVGVVFALSYFLLWSWGVFRIRAFDTIILGLLSGIIAIMVWGLYLSYHVHTPEISRKHYYAALLIAHIFFAAATVYSFYILQPEPEFYKDLMP